MTELFIFLIIQFVWLLVLQDKLAGLRSRIKRLEEKEKTNPAQTESEAAATQPETASAPLTEQPADEKPETALAAVQVETDGPAARAEEEKAPASSTQEPVSFVQVFSWTGGLLLLLSAIFAVKYAVALISPQARIALGFMFGALLWAAGVCIRKENLRTTAHTLAASGLAVCYASCFAAYHFYQILTPTAAIIVLAAVSLGAFATAVWKNAQFICVLAQCAGFLTPFLVAAPNPNWTAFLTYTLFIALASAAAACVRKWDGQLILCAAFTALCQLVTAEQAGTDASVLHVLMGFSLLFGALFAAASAVRKNGTSFLISTAACMLVIWDLPNARLLPDGFWGWSAGAFAFFAAAPFACKQRFMDDKPAWLAVCAAGLVGVHLYFSLTALYDVPQGLVPLFFAVLYGFLTEYTASWKTQEEKSVFRPAYLGATSSFFLTMAVVCQFKREWLTLMLALEGCALIWINRRYTHQRIAWLGKILLASSCVRLTLNPFIADYHLYEPRFFNWFLYIYGLCAGAMFWGAEGWNAKDKASVSFLKTLAGITLFALMNVEIANWFAIDGKLNWDMFGDLSVAAAFTVSWAVFGAACLFVALINKAQTLGGTGIVLIGLALAKLFLSDIWQLELGTRIIVLISVAVLLMSISFLYQRKKQA